MPSNQRFRQPPGPGRPEQPAVIVIPARWGSTRFPGKSLAMICGKPLIQRVVERARRAQSARHLLVATDDDRIRQAVLPLGVEVVMTRSDHPSGTDRVAEAVRGRTEQIVVNIQGDEPMMDPGLIDAVVDALSRDDDCAMATAAAPLTSPEDIVNPSVVKVVFGKDGQALYFSRAVVPHVRENDAGVERSEPLYWRHIGIYAYRKAFLEKLVKTPPCPLEKAEKLEQLRALWLGCRMKVVRATAASLGVDTPEDVGKAEAALRKAGLA